MYNRIIHPSTITITNTTQEMVSQGEKKKGEKTTMISMGMEQVLKQRWIRTEMLEVHSNVMHMTS